MRFLWSRKFLATNTSINGHVGPHNAFDFRPFEVARRRCPEALIHIKRLVASKKGATVGAETIAALMCAQTDLMVRRYHRSGEEPDDGYLRETFRLPVEVARVKAREILDQFPQGGYMTIVEQWRQLPDGQIEFTMRRLRAAIE